MEAPNSLIERQYQSTGLYEDILQQLGEQLDNISDVSRKDISGVDEFHVRGAEVSRELASQIKTLDLKFRQLAQSQAT